METLYRAVSRALYNTEEHHLLIRLKAALEIAMYPSYYDVEDPHYVDQVKDDRLLHDTYDGLLSSAATPGVPAEMLHIYAVSAVLSISVHSYCPPTISVGLLGGPLTRTVYGRSVRTAKSPDVTLMWTTMFVPKKACFFKPNHFVVLHDLRNPEVINLSTNSTEDLPLVDLTVINDKESPTLGALIHATPARHSKGYKPRILHTSTRLSLLSPQGKHRTNAFAAGKTCMADSCTADGSQADCCDVQVQVSFADSNDRDNSSSHCIEEGTCKNSVAENEAVSFRENSLADDTTDRSSDDTEESSDATPAGCIAEGGKELPIGPHAAPAFLAIDDCVTLIRSTNKDQVTDYVPRGTKENRYYLVKNTDNLKRRDEGKMSQFWDDCGTWAKGGPTTKTLYLCLPQKNLQKVVLKNEVYCWERTKQKKTVYIPLEPQPDDDHRQGHLLQFWELTRHTTWGNSTSLQQSSKT
ncbi:uncharacterized protein LOC135212098 [Macrobrachium nipponense]|uniref:uncharacterized protein LOC135212098 n=1 Tax=Macrobrachium nipponense TaxID=159736 RepID=UPI0030C89D0B